MISVIVPSRGRPLKLLRFIASTLLTAKDVEIIVVLDHPDLESQQVVKHLHGLKVIVMPETYEDGHPQLKYQTGYDAATGDLIVSGADDITWCPGWAQALLECKHQGYIGLWDKHHKRNLPTLIAVTRTYVDQIMGGRYGMPWYRVVRADREWMERAKAAGRYVVCEGATFDHHHPGFGEPEDERFKKFRHLIEQDRETYRQRQEKGFPNEWPS